MKGSRVGSSSEYEPLGPGSANVIAPREWADSNAASTSGSPSGGPNPITMSSGRRMTSSQSRNAMERSSAGRARLPTMTGWTNSTETCWASVAYGPRPKASRRPPRRKRSDISRQTSASCLASRAKNCSIISLRTSSRSSIRSVRLQAVFIAAFLTDARQRIADKHVYDPAAAISRGYQYGAGRFGSNLANDDRILSAFRPIQHVQSGVSVFRRNHGEKLTFVGNVQWVQAQQFARAANLVAHWNLFLRQHDAQAAVAGKLIERRGDASAGGIAHPANSRSGFFDHSFDQRQDAARVGRQVGFKVEFAAREEDGDAVVPNRSREDNFVAETNGSCIDGHLRHEAADTGGCDVHAVGFAALDYLRISADHDDSGTLKGGSHGADLALENRCGQSLFENEGDDHGLTPGS